MSQAHEKILHPFGLQGNQIRPQYNSTHYTPTRADIRGTPYPHLPKDEEEIQSHLPGEGPALKQLGDKWLNKHFSHTPNPSPSGGSPRKGDHFY